MIVTQFREGLYHLLDDQTGELVKDRGGTPFAGHIDQDKAIRMAGHINTSIAKKKEKEESNE